MFGHEIGTLIVASNKFFFGQKKSYSPPLPYVLLHGRITAHWAHYLAKTRIIFSDKCSGWLCTYFMTVPYGLKSAGSAPRDAFLWPSLYRKSDYQWGIGLLEFLVLQWVRTKQPICLVFFIVLLYCFSFPMIISNWSAFTQLEATLVIRSKSVNEPLKNSKNWLWLAVRSREEEAPRKKL